VTQMNGRGRPTVEWKDGAPHDAHRDASAGGQRFLLPTIDRMNSLNKRRIRHTLKFVGTMLLPIGFILVITELVSMLDLAARP